MRLALAFGRPDWRQLLDEIDPEDFADWQAFDEVEPIGERRADMRMRFLIKCMAAMNGVEPEDIGALNYLSDPTLEPPVPEITPEQSCENIRSTWLRGC